jgi:hypothetical protein
MNYAGGGSGSGTVYAYVTGQLLNRRDTPYELVVVKADFLTQGGEILRGNIDTVYGLEPNSPTEFSVQFPSPPNRPQLALEVDKYRVTLHRSADEIEIELPDRSVDSETPTPEEQPADADPPEPPAKNEQ